MRDLYGGLALIVTRLKHIDTLRELSAAPIILKTPSVARRGLIVL